jgi:hypothetical protein
MVDVLWYSTSTTLRPFADTALTPILRPPTDQRDRARPVRAS